MKRFLTPLIAVIVIFGGILTACSDKHPTGAVISGSVSGFPASDSVKVILFRHEGEVGRQFMADTLQGGRFRFVIDTLPDGIGKYSIGLFGKNGKYFRTVLNFNTDLYLEPGAKVRIKGEGMPTMGGKRGDLFVMVKVETPTHLSLKQKELLEEFRALDKTDSCQPETKTFFNKIKDLFN